MQSLGFLRYSVIRSLALAIAFVALSITFPDFAHAQFVEDKPLRSNSIAVLVNRFAEWYAIASEWRDAVVGKANAMLDHTRKLVHIREKYEQKAVGELGKLGDRVPDWRNAANYCGYDYKGVTVCNVDTRLQAYFENALYNVFYEYRDQTFGKIEEVENALYDLIGAPFARGAMWFENNYAGTPREYSTRSATFTQVQAESSPALEEAARNLNMLLDSIYATDIEGQEISSGRAQQLTAHLAYIEALTRLEQARAKLKSLDLAITTSATQVSGYRRRQSMIHSPVIW